MSVIGYLLPEFPGQTHIWMWREIDQLRRWGVPIRLFSTRRPPERDRARHSFAETAEAETTYLWPVSAPDGAAALLWALMTRPAGLLSCVRLALTLPIESRWRVLRLLALITPACVLAMHCRRASVRHLHCHSCSDAAILCMMVRRLAGVPFSLTLNADIAWWGGAMRPKLRDAAFTLAISRSLLDQVARECPALAPEQALLGRIGVDTRLWAPGARSEPADGTVRIITVARLDPIKRHDLLLDAVGALRRDGLPLSLTIVGDGPLRAELEARAQRSGLSGVVTFAGSLGQEEIIRRMRSSDLFVLPSDAEGLGVAFMESMAMEVATIGTRVGGVPEIIDDGVDGILVSPSDPEALARAIRRLADDPDLRRRIASAGRRKIISRFDCRIGAATLYDRLMGRPPPDAPGC